MIIDFLFQFKKVIVENIPYIIYNITPNINNGKLSKTKELLIVTFYYSVIYPL
jgi:hypothetical protein